MATETSSPEKSRPDFPTGTVTFLFTDIEGSTPLWERDPRGMQAAVSRHNAILQQAIQEHGGKVFEFIGDAFEAVFVLPQNALAAAVAAQRALAAADWNGTAGPLRVRMGIHTGPAERSGGHYVGHTLNRAARVMSAGHGGQVLLSGEAAELTRRQLAAGVQLKDLGEHKLKGLSFLEHLYQLVISGLQHEFPPLATHSAPRHNLPAQLTSFIGREKEIAELKELLGRSRLVTLTGSGGVGKTRLALKLATGILEDFPDGVWFVDLASLSDSDRLPHAITASLGLQEPVGLPVEEALLEYLRTRQMLLILDNCEHLLEACARLAERALKACPQVRLLATSREALGVPGEVAFHLPSLAVPEATHTLDLERLSNYEGVLLFTERAASAEPGFALNEHNAAAIVQISRRLDGIPLAIELAAARVKVLAPEQIATRLDDRFRLLTGGSRAALPRQQTLRASIDWSYSLLTEPERVLFRRLSVFTGGWSLEAAEQVCADEAPAGASGSPGGIREEDILDLLASLVDKSLVIKQTQIGEARYRRLETVRQYAHEKLLESGEAEELMDRHLAYFTNLAEIAAPELWRMNQVRWLNRLETEYDNLRAAFRWSLEAAHDEKLEIGLRLAISMEMFWWVRDYWREARDWLARLLERASTEPDSTLIFALKRLCGKFEFALGNYEQAGFHFKECLSFAQFSGEKKLEALASCGLGECVLISSKGSEFEPALVLAKRSLDLFSALGDLPGIATSLSILGTIHFTMNSYSKSEEYFQGTLSVCQQMGHLIGMAQALMWLSEIAFINRNNALANEYNSESLGIFRQAGDKWGINNALFGLANLEAQAGNLESAREHLEECLFISQEFNILSGEVSALRALGQLDRASGHFQQASQLLLQVINIRKRSNGASPPLTTANLGFVRLAEGDLPQAVELFIESLNAAQQYTWLDLVAMGLFGLAVWSGATGNWARGARWLGAALPELVLIDLADRQELERFQAAARQALGEEAYQAALEAGAQLGLEQAVAEALGGDPLAGLEQDIQDRQDE